MAEKSFSEVVDVIIKKDPRYRKGVYFFVRSALDFTLKNMKKRGDTGPTSHVSGQQLLSGIREFAIDQFGPLTPTVFDYWNIRQSGDFGNVVFNLIDVGVLGKNEQDSIQDFENGLDFKEAFVDPYLPSDFQKKAE